jgi:anti-sigma regulatory factor (Ser/Thr protein kinase)
MPDEWSTGSVRSIERGQRFEPAASSVRAARDFVAVALQDAGYEGDWDAVLLLVSELATNAVRHAATPYEIVIDAGIGRVRVAVIDGDGANPPQLQDPTPDDTNGRGLLIVDELAARWGSDLVGADNKAVWFTLS